MSNTALYDNSDQKFPFTISESNWNEYLRYRPKYPDSMWESWFRYHEAHGGKFDAAHDVGAGVGIASAVLATEFRHVFVSDPGESNITAARNYLTLPEKFTFSQTPGETPWLEDKSIDFTCICTALHFMDPVVTLKNIAMTLKPGGTLAICMYAFRLKFPKKPELEEIWTKLMRNAMNRLADEGKLSPLILGALARTLRGLDSIAVPNEYFEGVVRLMINIDESEMESFTSMDPVRYTAPPSEVRDDEEIRYVDDSGWSMEIDMDWLRGFLLSTAQRFDDDIWSSPEWKELEHSVNGELGGKTLVNIPATMIVASRRYVY